MRKVGDRPPITGSATRRTRLQLLAEREAFERSGSGSNSFGEGTSDGTTRRALGRADNRQKIESRDQLDARGKTVVDTGGISPVAVSVQNAANALGLSRTTVWDLVRAGHLPAKRIGNRVVIRVSDLATFVAGQPDYLE